MEKHRPIATESETAAELTVAAIVPTVRLLLERLEARGVRYCHWKSNDALARSATAENDLDLLIDEAQRLPFEELLVELGFRRAQAPATAAMPGVLDFLACDADEAVLVHVHAHFRLIVGDDRTKNYHLPLEPLYLRSTTTRLGFRVPPPEVEYIGFVVRMVLKHASWEAVLEGLATLPAASRRELDDLRSRVDAPTLLRTLDSADFLAPVFEPCARAIEADASAWSKMRAGRLLRRVLGPHRRRGRFADLWLKGWRRFVQGVQRRLGGLPKARLDTGGSLVAVVGGDGSGKTTLLDDLHRDWSRELDVRRVHLGKPGASAGTRFMRGLAKLARLVARRPYLSSAEVLYGPAERLPSFPGYGYLLRELCISRDRRRACLRARRAARSGAIVLCDRFPLSGLSMDGAILARSIKQSNRSWLTRALVRLDEAYYRDIDPPDVLVVLRLDPDTAAARKTDEDADYVRARTAEMSRFHAPSGAIEVDASRPREIIAAEVRRRVWSAL